MPLANLQQKEQHGLKNEETQKHRETSSGCVAQSDPGRAQIESKCVLLPFSEFWVAGGNMINRKRRKTRKNTCGFRARGPMYTKNTINYVLYSSAGPHLHEKHYKTRVIFERKKKVFFRLASADRKTNAKPLKTRNQKTL
jgi:hypothetical protein